ncbi:MAG: hypothetical protein HYT21_02315 [Candidatus Nealsonbacteria bacterium]|nr:hypothetical protein [Candidatus Nealsonbacteria bacterium]
MAEKETKKIGDCPLCEVSEDTIEKLKQAGKKKSGNEEKIIIQNNNN